MHRKIGDFRETPNDRGPRFLMRSFKKIKKITKKVFYKICFLICYDLYQIYVKFLLILLINNILVAVDINFFKCLSVWFIELSFYWCCHLCCHYLCVTNECFLHSYLSYFCLLAKLLFDKHTVSGRFCVNIPKLYNRELKNSRIFV